MMRFNNQYSNLQNNNLSSQKPTPYPRLERRGFALSNGESSNSNHIVNRKQDCIAVEESKNDNESIKKYNEPVTGPNHIEEKKQEPTNLNLQESGIPILTAELGSKRVSEEFECLIKEKLGKIDEIMLALKEIQDAKNVLPPLTPSLVKEQESWKSTGLPIVNQETDNGREINRFQASSGGAGKRDPNSNSFNNIQPYDTDNMLTKKRTRFKRSYYPVTENKWNELKTAFSELTDEHKKLVFSDGEKNYIELKNKKVELNYKAILKLLSKK